MTAEVMHLSKSVKIHHPKPINNANRFVPIVLIVYIDLINFKYNAGMETLSLVSQVFLFCCSRRYAAMQGQSPPPTDHMHEVKQTSAIMEDTSISLGNGRFSQPPFFPQVNHPSLPPFHNSLLGEGESVSNFVTLLKGTLERKKMGNGHRQQHQQQQWVSESCPPQRFYEDLQNRMDGSQNQVSSALQLGGLGQMQHEGYGQVRTTGQIQSEGQPPQIDGVISGNNQSQPGLLSHAPSPSESSAGAPVLSAGEDPCNSGQTTSLKRAWFHFPGRPTTLIGRIMVP